MASNQSYLEKLWGRVPWFFILVGFAFLGFGRKAQSFQEAGGNLPPTSIAIASIIVGVLLFGFQIYRRQSQSGEESSKQSQSSEEFSEG